MNLLRRISVKLRLYAAARKMDCIIHTAFVNGTGYFYSRPELVLDVGGHKDDQCLGGL